MEFFANIVEYYDELYPITDSLKKFCSQIKKEYPLPTKALQIGCNTGSFCFYLAKDGWDSTGLETNPALLESASTKRRTQLLSIRFFKLSTLEMTKFLGNGFYNLITCLDNRILFLKTKELMQQFFTDSKKLLCNGGTMVLQTFNLEKTDSKGTTILPSKNSIRVDLYSKISAENDGYYLDQEIETGNGKITPIIQNERIFLLTKKDILSFGKDAGFKQIDFYSDYDMSPVTEDSPFIITVLKA